jgi:hypothetical protein
MLTFRGFHNPSERRQYRRARLALAQRRACSPSGSLTARHAVDSDRSQTPSPEIANRADPAEVGEIQTQNAENAGHPD